MPPVILAVAAAVAASAAATAAGLVVGTLAYAIVSALVAAAIDVIGSMLLAPHKSSAAGAPPSITNNTLSVRQPITTHKIIYGQVRVGGALTFWDTTSGNNVIYLLYTMACHPCQEIGAIYFNNTFVPLDASGNAVVPLTLADGTVPVSYAGCAQIMGGLGTVEGDLSLQTELLSGSKKWTAACHQYDRAKLLVKLTWNQTAFGPSGLPNVAAVIKGRPLFDPRVTPTALASVTAGSPGVFVSSGSHNLSAGDLIWFQNIAGTTPAIDQQYEVGTTPSGTTFTVLGSDSQPLAVSVGETGSGEFTLMTWTDNTTLAGNDYLCDPIYGFNAIYTDEIPAAVQIASANNCDEIVAIAGLLSTTFTVSGSTLTIPTLASGADPGITLGMPLTVSPGLGTLPPPLAANTVYYAVPQGDLTMLLATSLANAIAGTTITLTGAGVGPPWNLAQVEPFTAKAWTSSAPFGSGDWLQLVDTTARLTTGTRVTLGTTGTLPAPLATSTEYFCIFVTDTIVELATTLANARLHTNIAIADAGSGTHFIRPDAEPRYTANGVADTANTRQDIMNQLLSSMGGYLVPNGVELGLFSAVYRTPTIVLDEDDLDGPISVQTLNSGQVSYNGVRGQFQDPFSSGLPTDLPSLQNPTYVAADNGETVLKDVDLPFTNSTSMGQRLFNIELERVRRELTLTMSCKLTAFEVSVPDVIEVDNVKWGWSDETFEVQNWKVAVRQGNGSDSYLGCDIIGRQTDSAVFSWNTTQQLPQKTWASTNLPNPNVAAPPTGIAVNSGPGYLYIQQDGTVFPQLVVSWTPPVDQFVQNGGFIECQYALTGTGIWQNAQPVPGAVTFLNILNVQVGTAYDVRIRSQNQQGVYSDTGAVWTETITNYTILGPGTGPSPPTSLTVASTIRGQYLVWDLPADPSIGGTEILMNTINDRSSAFSRGIVNANNYPMNGLISGQTYYVWLRCIDRSGNVGTTTYPAGATSGQAVTPSTADTGDITPAAATNIVYSTSGTGIFGKFMISTPTTVAGGSITTSGFPVQIEISVPSIVNATNTSGYVVVVLQRDGATIQTIIDSSLGTGNPNYPSGAMAVNFTDGGASAGSHTYTVISTANSISSDFGSIGYNPSMTLTEIKR